MTIFNEDTVTSLMLTDGIRTVWSWAEIDSATDTTHLQLILVDSSGVESIIDAGLTTVSGINGVGAKEITYPLVGSAVATGSSFYIKRVVPLYQGFDGDVTRLHLPLIEAALDNLQRQVQQINNTLGNSLKTTSSSGDVGELVPSAGDIIGWNNEDPTQLINYSLPSAVLPSVTVGEARNNVQVDSDGVFLEYKPKPYIDPRDYNAVTGGLVDATAELQAAAVAAGEDGIMINDGQTYLITDRELVQCDRIGSGFIKIGSELYPWNNVKHNINQYKEDFVGSSVISNSLYSAFAVTARTKNNNQVVIFTHSTNHGQADKEGICLPQAVVSASNLTIDGNYESGGIVTRGQGAGDGTGATRIGITSDADDSTVVFTIVGTYQGVAKSYNVTGVNANTVYTTSSELLDVITQISTSAACSGTINAGTWMNPSNIEFTRTITGGGTWDSLVSMIDGMTLGDTYNYFPAMGILPDGTLIILYMTFNIEGFSAGTADYQIMARKSKDEFTFSPQEEITLSYTGTAPSTTESFYSDIKTKLDGTLYACMYSGLQNWYMSSQNGTDWAGNLMVTETTEAYSEAGIAFVDNDNGFAVMRVDGSTSSMRQYKTTDDGVTWVDQGALNIPISGGYVSPTLATIYVDGKQYIKLAYMARSSASSPPPNPDSMIFRYILASGAIAGSTNWSEEDVIINGTLPDNSGYPSSSINPFTNTVGMVYHEEASPKASSVKFKGVEIADAIRNKTNLDTDSVISFNSVTFTKDADNNRFIKDPATKMVKGRIEIDFSSLDTTDVSGISLVVSGFPYTVVESGMCQLDTEISTGVLFATADVVECHFNSANTILQVLNSRGIGYAYNGGEILASGKLVFYVEYLSD